MRLFDQHDAAQSRHLHRCCPLGQRPVAQTAVPVEAPGPGARDRVDLPGLGGEGGREGPALPIDGRVGGGVRPAEPEGRLRPEAQPGPEVAPRVAAGEVGPAGADGHPLEARAALLLHGVDADLDVLGERGQHALGLRHGGREEGAEGRVRGERPVPLLRRGGQLLHVVGEAAGALLRERPAQSDIGGVDPAVPVGRRCDPSLDVGDEGVEVHGSGALVGGGGDQARRQGARRDEDTNEDLPHPAPPGERARGPPPLP